MRKLLFVIIVLLSYLCVKANSPEYGLHIRSHPLPFSEFTSMVLENGQPIRTRGQELEVCFDLWVRQEHVFGSVLRIITNRGQNIDLMYRVDENDIDVRRPFLLVGDSYAIIETPTSTEMWLNVTLSLNPRTGQVVLQYDNDRVEITHPNLRGTRSVRIAFGYCPFENFGLNDIASVNIRNVRLKRNNQLIRHWRMAQHHGDICYDEIAHAPALGRNTQWIINDRITWRKIYEQSFNTTPAITFDSIDNRFFIVTDREIVTVPLQIVPSAYTFDIKQVVLAREDFLATLHNQILYVPSLQQLLFYNLTEDTYSVFDFTQNRWTNRELPMLESNFWNTSTIFNPADSSLISFGGYGRYLFHNELLISFPFHSDRPQIRTNLSEIAPRHSASTALVGEMLYIFGGRGSPTGRQELFPRNYYDLYAVDLTDKTVTRFWSIPESPTYRDFLPGENMIHDPETNSFLFFSSQRGGILKRICTRQAAFELMSLPIEIDLAAQYLYTNLFFAPELQKLYASIILSQVGGASHVMIYELDWPPTPVSFSLQEHTETSESAFRKTWWLLFGAILFLAAFHLVMRWRRKKKQIALIALKEKRIKGEHIAPTESAFVFEEEHSEQKHYQYSKSAICFLGRFRAIDKEGNDITSSFSTTTRLLLVALVCYSAKDSRGIKGSNLHQLLWHDKSEEAARNSRNVYISKLRTLLEKIGDIKIITENHYWRIEIGNDAVCDYSEMMKLFESKDNTTIEQMIELLIKGAMLPGIEVDWVDAFKNDFADKSIEFLHKILKTKTANDKLNLKIADAIFQHDFLSEEALHVKCSILYRQNKKGLAKNIFDAFCNRYKSSLGTDYQYSFMQVVEGELTGL